MRNNIGFGGKSFRQQQDQLAASLGRAESVRTFHRMLSDEDLRVVAGESGRRVVTDEEYRIHEAIVAEMARRSNSPIGALPAALIKWAAGNVGFTATLEQEAAIDGLLSNRVSIIHGEAGSGKTSLVTVAAKALALHEPWRNTVVAAFSSRVAMATARKAGIRGLTLHALTGTKPGSRASRGEMIDPRISAIFVDEAFSVEPDMLLRVMRQANWNTRLVFLGDPGQMLPIAGGRPLHDVLDCAIVPTFRLPVSHRLAGSAHLRAQVGRIETGRVPMEGPGLRIRSTAGAPNGERAKAAQAARLLSASVAQGKRCVVLTATRYGECGHVAINRLITGRSPRIGDEMLTVAADPGRRWRNGERAVIAGIDDGQGPDRMMTLEFDDGRLERTRHDDAAVAVGFAMSGHRGQGLEYDTAVVVLDRTGSRMLSRQYLSSVITRAPECTILTDPGLLEIAVRKNDLALRAETLKSIVGKPTR